MVGNEEYLLVLGRYGLRIVSRIIKFNWKRSYLIRQNHVAIDEGKRKGPLSQRTSGVVVNNDDNQEQTIISGVVVEFPVWRGKRTTGVVVKGNNKLQHLRMSIRACCGAVDCS